MNMLFDMDGTIIGYRPKAPSMGSYTIDDHPVTEEFLKLYVAYKAETSFVDAVPQAKVGRWGNGDVEVRLTKLEDLPDVMGLVRQALEKQMGN